MMTKRKSTFPLLLLALMAGLSFVSCSDAFLGGTPSSGKAMKSLMMYSFYGADCAYMMPGMMGQKVDNGSDMDSDDAAFEAMKPDTIMHGSVFQMP
jgi:hypothetical protein